MFTRMYALLLGILSLRTASSSVVEVEPSQVHRVEAKPEGLLNIYCYAGGSKALHRIWETVQLELNLTEGFDVFEGETPEEVRLKFKEQSSSWNILGNLQAWKRRVVRLQPFNQTCIGIHTKNQYHVQLQRIRVDYWKVLYLVLGTLLLFYSPKLAKNSAFYYITGTSVGSIALLLFMVYLFSRLFPRKPVMYTVLAGGWSVCLYLLQMLCENLRLVMTEYRSYLLTCLSFTSLVSFIICYRFGPVSHPRSLDLIQWTLQVLGLALVFISSEFQEASIAIIILLLGFYNLPKWFLPTAFSAVYRKVRRPKPRRLLSDDEFHQESVVETTRALDHLRQFCSSPECNQWRTVLRLKDPLRFAKFVQGSSHLTDDEVLAFETTHNKSLFSEDSSGTASDSD